MPEEYSYSEIMQMQDKAIERVRQMQERARRTVEENPIVPPEAEKVTALPEKTHTAEKNEQENRQKGNILSSIMQGADRDRLTLLPLIMLLLNEGADSLLLLALIYIMA